MAGDRRDVLQRKYLSLGTGEFAAATMFALVAATAVGPRVGQPAEAALWSALAPLLLILIQASAYWLLARRWVGQGTMPVRLAACYRTFRVVDTFALAAGLAGVQVWWPDNWRAALTVAGVWVFGLAEYVNYFLVRLAYPVRRWPSAVGQWRTPQLVRDLRDSAR